MKMILSFVFGLLLFSACNEDKTNGGFIDEYIDSYPDDGISCYAYYRIANATDYPLTVGVCESGTDIEYGKTCEPGHAFVYAVVSPQEAPFDRDFAYISLSFRYPERAESYYSYPNFGTPSASPDLCDESQWHSERINDRIIWRTYYVTDADYRTAAAKQWQETR